MNTIKFNIEINVVTAFYLVGLSVTNENDPMIGKDLISLRKAIYNAKPIINAEILNNVYFEKLDEDQKMELLKLIEKLNSKSKD